MVASRGGSRAAATSKMECFVILVNGWLDVAATLDPPLAFVETHALGHRTYAS